MSARTEVTSGMRTVILFTLIAVLAALNLYFTAYHAQRDEHRWCNVLSDLKTTAMTDRARGDFTQLARQFGCR